MTESYVAFQLEDEMITNPEIIKLKGNEWICRLSNKEITEEEKESTQEEEIQEEAFLLDIRRSGKIFGIGLDSQLTEKELEKKIKELLREKYQYQSSTELENDFNNLKKFWSQKISTIFKNAITLSLNSDPLTAHLMPVCDYEFNITKENGVIHVDILYRDFYLINKNSLDKTAIAGNITTRWDLTPKGFQLKEFKINNKLLENFCLHNLSEENNISFIFKTKLKIEKIWRISEQYKPGSIPPGIEFIYSKCLEAIKTNNYDDAALAIADKKSEIIKKKTEDSFIKSFNRLFVKEKPDFKKSNTFYLENEKSKKFK